MNDERARREAEALRFKRQGGAAFPVPHAIDGNWVREPLREFSGLTKRDYFAIMVLQGLLASEGIKEMDAPERANYAVYQAEELLKSLADG